jgi:hypothetical protein
MVSPKKQMIKDMRRYIGVEGISDLYLSNYMILRSESKIWMRWELISRY